nr:MAG TPA: hypothetical protein [Bacteriophage sp.]
MVEKMSDVEPPQAILSARITCVAMPSARIGPS